MSDNTPQLPNIHLSKEQHQLFALLVRKKTPDDITAKLGISEQELDQKMAELFSTIGKSSADPIGYDDETWRTRITRTSLSHRERTILSHIAAGLTNAEIADLMNLNVKAVKYTVKKLFDTLDADTRTQLALKANQLGLVPDKTSSHSR